MSKLNMEKDCRKIVKGLKNSASTNFNYMVDEKQLEKDCDKQDPFLLFCAVTNEKTIANKYLTNVAARLLKTSKKGIVSLGAGNGKLDISIIKAYWSKY